MTDLETYGEIRDMYRHAECAGQQEDFVSFLRHCAERLQHGASVEEIWNDWRTQKQRHR